MGSQKPMTAKTFTPARVRRWFEAHGFRVEVTSRHTMIVLDPQHYDQELCRVWVERDGSVVGVEVVGTLLDARARSYEMLERTLHNHLEEQRGVLHKQQRRFSGGTR